MATTPNYAWEIPDDTDLVKDGALAIRTLGDAIDATVFANSSAGGFTKLARVSFTSQSVQAFNSIFTTAHGSYLIVIEDLFSSSTTAALNMRVKYGTTTEVTAYDLANINTDIGGSTVTATNSANGTEWQIGRRSGENDTFKKGSGYLIISRIGTGTTSYPAINGQYMATGSGTNRVHNNFGGEIRGGQTYDGFELAGSAGNITGIVSIYGMSV
jgi:hypothetical protein